MVAENCKVNCLLKLFASTIPRYITMNDSIGALSGVGALIHKDEFEEGACWNKGN